MFDPAIYDGTIYDTGGVDFSHACRRTIASTTPVRTLQSTTPVRTLACLED